jgi:hypothetical protein
VAVAGLLPAAPVRAAPSDPAAWPEVAGRDPELTTTAHTVRFAGPNRFQTNEAIDLALRGTGDFPFDTSDRTEPGDWWGAASCPRAILVVAGDTFTDALAAASLSDPTDRSDQPRLVRSAAADPDFDRVGDVDRVDTAYAPIVVTDSGRSGATALAATARATAIDLAGGGCTTAREAVIVGGTGAVPGTVEAELVGLGYEEVFRVAGANRYETAARVATALGTGTPTATTCLDVDSTDGTTQVGWYGNAVAEFRPRPTACRLLPRAVVLAEGGTGADALAAGWWTSQWQVPVLLTAPDGSLPAATRSALSSLTIDTLIVLGGTARIPEATVDEAKALATAVAGRIAGTDRYATSVAMAEQFGGWNATGDADDFADDLLCVAASGGSGSASTGWPDALAAGPLCGRLGATGGGGPARDLAPVTGPDASVTVGVDAPAHAMVPILLVPTGAAALPQVTADALASWFVTDERWCTAGSAPAGCRGPAFGVLLGGPAVVRPEVAAQLTDALAGVGGAPPGAPAAVGFATRLDLSTLFAGPSGAGSRVCFDRGTVTAARWLSATADPERRAFRRESDLVAAHLYDGSGSLPLCVELQAGDTVTPVGTDGAVGPGSSYDPARDGVALSRAIQQSGRLQTTGGGTHIGTAGAPDASVQLLAAGTSAPVTAATLDLELRSTSEGYSTVRGTAQLTTAQGTRTGGVVGEARMVAGRWELRGSIRLGFSNDGELVIGGFSATATPQTEDAATLTWALDGSIRTGGA